MNAWRSDTLALFDIWDRLILMLAAGDDKRLNRLTWHCTHADLAQTYLSKLING